MTQHNHHVKSLKIELAEARGLALRYHDITASIAKALDGTEWTSETLNNVADILRNAGFRRFEINNKRRTQ